MRGPVVLRAAELAGTRPSLALRLAGQGVVGGGGPEGASPRTASTTTTTTPSEGARQPDPALLGSKLRCAAPSDAPPAACAARARSFDPPPHSYPRLLRLRRCCFPYSTPLHSTPLLLLVLVLSLSSPRASPRLPPAAPPDHHLAVPCPALASNGAVALPRHFFVATPRCFRAAGRPAVSLPTPGTGGYRVYLEEGVIANIWSSSVSSVAWACN